LITLDLEDETLLH